jgi:hypothetical protein
MSKKQVEFEMTSIGWNMGQYGHKRTERALSIEILELKIDGVDILKQLEAIKTQFDNKPLHADHRRFGDFYEAYDEWLYECHKILEGSQFTTKGDKDED